MTTLRSSPEEASVEVEDSEAGLEDLEAGPSEGVVRQVASSMFGLTKRVERVEQKVNEFVKEYDTGLMISSDSALSIPLKRRSFNGNYRDAGLVYFRESRRPKCHYIREDGFGGFTFMKVGSDFEVDHEGKAVPPKPEVRGAYGGSGGYCPPDGMLPGGIPARVPPNGIVMTFVRQDHAPTPRKKRKVVAAKKKVGRPRKKGV